VEWAVPGLREGLVNELLRALPKSLRRELQPFPPKVAEIVRDLEPAGASLQQDLAAFIRRRYGVEIPPGAWPADAVPAHLRPRIEVVGHDQKVLGTSRDLGALRHTLEQVQAKPAPDNSAWQRAVQAWERPRLIAWDFGDLPERITISETGPVPVFAWPGLRLEEGVVHLRLFRAAAEGRQASLGGIQKLVELVLSKDFAWLHRDLRMLQRFEALLAGWTNAEELQTTAYAHLKRHLLPAAVFEPLSRANFDQAVQQTRLQIPGLAVKLVDDVGPVLRARQEIAARCGPAPAPARGQLNRLSDLSQLRLAGPAPAPVAPANPWAQELAALVPADFLTRTPFAQLRQLPRYLKALGIRMERAKLSPAKDQERVQLLAPYAAKAKALHASGSDRAEAFRWMMEEYKVSLFAQELGTAFPISPKRLDEFLARSG